MKYGTVVLIVLATAIAAQAADDSRTIRVDRTTFSEIYPAVWFSPSTGEITSLKERSEVPPAENYEIWIEPGDPEFGYNPEKKPTGIGFALIGKGFDVFEDSKIPSNLKLDLKLTNLMQEDQAPGQPVFYCRAKTARCLIMVIRMDVKVQVLEFKWRPLSRDSEIPGEPQDPVSSMLDSFADAVVARDMRKAESLFLPPDDTPDGKNRERHIEEMKKDWSRATQRDPFAAVKFKNTTVLVHTQMVLVGKEAKPAVIPVEFKVSFGEDGYKIVAMKYLDAN